MEHYLPIGLLFVLPAIVHAAEPGPSKLNYTSGGQKITVERFEPKNGAAKLPAILFLHGSDGFTRRGDDYRKGAQMTADQGYVVFMPHYFERTGDKEASREAIDKSFLHWVAAVQDAMTFARDDKKVDKTRVALVGYSLGGYVALTLGATAFKDEHKPAAIVEYFGGLPKIVAPAAGRLPPVLILHGEKDPIVPVKEATDLEQVLKQKKVPYEIKIYPGEGHGFSDKIALEAMALGVKFLDKHMNNDMGKKE